MSERHSRSELHSFPDSNPETDGSPSKELHSNLFKYVAVVYYNCSAD